MDNFYVWPDNNIIRQRYIANKILYLRLKTAVTQFCSNISEKILYKTKITRPFNRCYLFHHNLYWITKWLSRLPAVLECTITK